MDVQKFQLHHERDNTRFYSESDHRVQHEVCNHTRYFDKAFPVTGTCLDCGATIMLGTWEIVEGEPHLIDAHLKSERVRYNLLWQGFGTYTEAEAPHNIREE